MSIKNIRILNVGGKGKVLPSFLSYADRNRTDKELDVCFGPFPEPESENHIKKEFQKTYVSRRKR